MTDDTDDEGFRTVHPACGVDIQPVDAYAADPHYVQQDRGPVHAVAAMEEDKEREAVEERVRARAHWPGWRDPRGLSREELAALYVELMTPQERQNMLTSHFRGLLDNAALTAPQPPFRGPGLGAMTGIGTRLDRVVKEKRVSKVFRIWDWPRGVRDRGWGLLHDQIWFYDEIPVNTAMRCVPGTEETDPIYFTGRHYWRHEMDGTTVRWLRLYMDRKMLWLPRWVARLRIWNRFRIHHFFSGDDDSAPHDHPWSFWTIPFFRYTETVELKAEDASEMCQTMPLDTRFVQWVGDGMEYARVTHRVSRWWPQFRSALHRHFVHEPEQPFRTLVLARETTPARKWGFWPAPTEFVPYDVWTKYTK